MRRLQLALWTTAGLMINLLPFDVAHAEHCSTPPATKSCISAGKGAEYAIRWEPTTDQPEALRTLQGTLSILGIVPAADATEKRTIAYYTNVDRAGLEVPDPKTKVIVRVRDGEKKDLTYKLRGGVFSCLCPFGDSADKPTLECDITVSGAADPPDPSTWTCKQSFSCTLPEGDEAAAGKFFGTGLEKHEATMERVTHKPAGQKKKLKIEAWTIAGVLRIIEVSQDGDACELPGTFADLVVKPLLAAGVKPADLSKEALVTGREP